MNATTTIKRSRLWSLKVIILWVTKVECPLLSLFFAALSMVFILTIRSSINFRITINIIRSKRLMAWLCTFYLLFTIFFFLILHSVCCHRNQTKVSCQEVFMHPFFLQSTVSRSVISSWSKEAHPSTCLIFDPYLSLKWLSKRWLAFILDIIIHTLHHPYHHTLAIFLCRKISSHTRLHLTESLHRVSLQTPTEWLITTNSPF